MIPWERFKILPLLVFVAALSFSFRAAEFFGGFSSMPGSVFAQDAQPPKEPLNAPAADAEKEAADKVSADPAKEETAKAEDSHESEAPQGEAAKTNTGVPATPAPQEKVDWKSSTDSDLEYSDVKMEMFEDLANRRKDVEERERELVLREALLKAAEQEIDQKYKELEGLKDEIQGLLEQQSEEEKKRVASLVKIYEGMKAKDAARIFDTLDMDVLLQVMTEMSERKSAPILAAMNPDRARSVTIMLAEQKKIPSLAEPLIPQN